MSTDKLYRLRCRSRVLVQCWPLWYYTVVHVHVTCIYRYSQDLSQFCNTAPKFSTVKIKTKNEHKYTMIHSTKCIKHRL